MAPPGDRKIVFVVTEDWAFLSHRLPMARAAKSLGLEVVVATRMNDGADTIRANGFRVVHVPFQRRSTNPLRELGNVMRLIAIFRREQPDIVHNVALKPILDGSLAALFVPGCHVVNIFTGLGAMFIDTDRYGGLQRRLVPLFRFLLSRRQTWAIVQNDDDAQCLRELGVIQPDRTVTIRGSGVDLDAFSVQPEPTGTVTATIVSRLLWDKGIAEVVEAARLLKARGTPVRVAVVGGFDEGNPNAIDAATVAAWRAEGIVDFRGPCDDVAAVWAASHVALLPSYREGLPKSLLEAAACGRPMVATDVPGCRALVRHEENGLLVPVRDAAALADAIARLAGDEELRRQLGTAARQAVERCYADAVITAETGAFYRRLLDDRASR